jgi:hypothetical protein
MKRSIVPIGIVLAILGFYGPWVTNSHNVAALTYNALDLTEFSKFIVRAHGSTVAREVFLVPVVAAALALALWASHPNRPSRVLRYTLTFAAAVFTLVPLPPYLPGMSPLSFLSLVAYRSDGAENHGSFWLSVASLLGVVLIFVWGRRIAARWRCITFVAFALIGAVPAAWEFFTRALPAISTAYGSPAPPAWGFCLTMLGFALVMASAVMRET